MAATLMLRITVGEKAYELDPTLLTIGDAATLRTDYGLENVLEFSTLDPQQMLGMLAITIAREDEIPLADAQAKAATVRLVPVMEDILEQLNALMEEAKAEHTPPLAANGSAKPAAASRKAGKSGKNHGARGPRRSAGSTGSSPGK